MIKITQKVELDGFRELDQKNKSLVKEIVDDAVKFSDFSLQSVARVGHGMMKGQIRHELISRTEGRIRFGADYTHYVDNRYGFSPAEVPTGLSMVRQTHSRKGGSKLAKIVKEELSPEIQKRANKLTERKLK